MLPFCDFNGAGGAERGEAPAKVDEVEKKAVLEARMFADPVFKVGKADLPVCPVGVGGRNDAGLSAEIIAVEWVGEKADLPVLELEVVKDKFGIFGKIACLVEGLLFGNASNK